MKKVLFTLIAVIVLGATWYLFIKPEDYLVRFKANTTIGTINQAIKSWELAKENITRLPASVDNKVVQELIYGDSIHTYTWKLKPLNDSTTQVILGVKDKKNSINNKLRVLYASSFIKEQSKKTAEDFLSGLRDHLEQFDVTVDGESATPPSFAAYVTINGTQVEKAGGMMRYYGYLSQLMLKDGIEPKGPPFIEVVNWDQKKDSLTYNFCFPIKNKENLPEFPEIKYKRFFEKKALKATYHGNYITSDRAWYRLLAYAEENGYELEKLPFEIFHDNPSLGANERNWRAEIFLPIKE